MKKVQVLLSTYNGEKYLREQLDSLLEQDYENIEVLIRDDGSTDGTISILEEYCKRDDRIQYYQGKNIGVIQSFFDLMMKSDTLAEYYAFADQDDVWKQNKVSSAVKKLNGMNSNLPLLYCGKTTLVNEDLDPIISTIKTVKIRPYFGNALVENICIGCTGIINKELLKLIQTHIPSFTVMHDWWLYLTASCFGEVYYDENSCILYRQHGNNIVGTKSNYFDEFKKRLKNYKNYSGKVSRQAKEFQKLFGPEGENSELLSDVINAKRHFSCRIKMLFTKKIYRQRKMDNIIFKVLFLIGHV